MVQLEDHGEGVERTKQEAGVSGYKLLCTEWMNTEVLHSTENYTQHPMTAEMEKSRNKAYVCITEPFCCKAII